MKKFVFYKIVLMGLVATIMIANFLLSFFEYYRDKYEYRDVVEASAGSVVRVTTNDGSSGGTGFIANTLRGPMVITNRHVCDGADKYKRIETQSGALIIGNIFKIDFDADLCAIGPIKYFGDSLKISQEFPKKYDNIYSVGYPLLESLVVSEGRSLETMMISIAGRVHSASSCEEQHGILVEDPFWGMFCVYNMTITNTSMRIFPGCSGSPVLNSHGEVIGVVAVGNSKTDYGGYVPLPYLKKFVESL